MGDTVGRNSNLVTARFADKGHPLGEATVAPLLSIPLILRGSSDTKVRPLVISGIIINVVYHHV